MLNGYVYYWIVEFLGDFFCIYENGGILIEKIELKSVVW